MMRQITPIPDATPPEIFERIENGSLEAYRDLVTGLTEDFLRVSKPEAFLPVSALRESCRQYLESVSLSDSRRLLFYRAQSDALIAVMRGMASPKVASIGVALGQFLERLGVADEGIELLLRLHYLSGLSWDEIGELPGLQARIGDPVEATIALGKKLEQVGLSLRILQEQYLKPRGNVTRMLADVRDGRQSLGDVIASEEIKLRRHAGRLLQSERHISLRATELVNELFLRLPKDPAKAPLNQLDMNRLADVLMRHILTDRARKRTPGRGKTRAEMPVEVKAAAVPVDETLFREQVLKATEKVLADLRRSDKDSAEMLEAVLFRNAEQKDLAKLHEVSLSTVKRRIRDGKATIRRHLGLDQPNDS